VKFSFKFIWIKNSRKICFAWNVACMEHDGKADTVSVGISERNQTTGTNQAEVGG
jgi:hypothetical protein